MSREENRCTTRKWGHACKYKGGKCLEGKPRHKSSASSSRYLFSPLNICFRKGKTHPKCVFQKGSQSNPLASASLPLPSRIRTPLPSSRWLGCGWFGWRAHFFPAPVFFLHIPHPPCYSLSFSKTFDPEKHIESRFGKAETNQLPF